MSDLEIRIASRADATTLAALIAGFRDHLHAELPTDADIRAHLPRALADSAIEFSCAWSNGEAVGYTQSRFLNSVWVAGIEAHLEDLFVVSTARRRGVGRSLFRHALARAQALGASRFSLNTNERNEAAHSLYRSEGLSPQSHALYPGGREVLWVRNLGATYRDAAADGREGARPGVRHPMSLDPAWEAKAREWARFARSPEHDHFFWSFNGPRFLELIPSPGRITLDLACGEGRLGRLLGERGHRVLGIDASLAMGRLAHEAGGQHIVVGNASRLPLASGTADLAVAFMSLQDIADLAAAVAEVARVLVRGGRFCIALAHPIRSSGHFTTKQADSAFSLSSYFEPRPWPWRTRHTGLQLELPGIHRPLEAYTAALESQAFVIEAMREPQPAPEQASIHPESARWLRVPCFLHIRAVRS